jgi:UDP-glucose 4-epimerase
LGNQSAKREDLISALMEVAAGKKDKFIIFGTDYDTRDGSCIRDIIQVNDLAKAHILAIDYLNKSKEPIIINLGSENGFSVIESVKRTQELTGVNFPVIEGKRRQGDIIVSIASSQKAKDLLSWKPKYSSLETIIETAWSWEKQLQ